MPRLPSLNALRAFEAVARAGSVSAAAEDLHVTPSAVSRQLAALEDDMGAPLLERDGRGLRLTAAGESLARGLGPAFDGIAETVARTRRDTNRGKVYLSVMMVFAKTWLVPRLGRFHAEEPEVDVILHQDPGQDRDSGAGSDLVVTWGDGRAGARGYAVEKLGDEEVFPVCAPAVARRAAERGGLAGLPLLHYADVPQGWEWPTWPAFLAATGIEGGDAAHGSYFSRPLIVDAARAGEGVLLLNATASRDDLAAGRLVRPVAESMRIDSGYLLLTPKDRPVRREVAAFRDWLRDEFRACFEEIPPPPAQRMTLLTRLTR